MPKSAPLPIPACHPNAHTPSPPPANTKTPLVQLKNVTKIYTAGATAFRALDNVSLEILQGEMTAIIGPSGSGKSTLLHLIGCLDLPEKGDIQICGQSLTTLRDAALSSLRGRLIGFIFQSFHLLPRFSVLENIALPMAYAGVPKHQRTQRAKALAEKVGLGTRLQSRPNQLSGGQCQRVAIARALANQPELILADEPTGNLDSTTGSEILELLLKLNREGRTILLVTHDPKVASLCRRVITIADGKVVSDTNPPHPAATNPHPL